MKRKLFSLLLALCMVLAILPTTAAAENSGIQTPLPAADTIYIGSNIALSDGEYLPAGSTEATKTAPADNYAYYENGVLTLKNYAYDGSYGGTYVAEHENTYAIYSDGSLSINLIGENDIYLTGRADIIGIYGIYTESNLNITSDANGSLNIYADHRAIQCNGNISIYSGIVNCSTSGYYSIGNISAKNSLLDGGILISDNHIYFEKFAMESGSLQISTHMYPGPMRSSITGTDLNSENTKFNQTLNIIASVNQDGSNAEPYVLENQDTYRYIYAYTDTPSVEGVYRLAGSNRFDTAFKSADALKEVMGVDKFPAAIVTSGMNFADALAGSYLAARTGAPILLTDNDNMADVIAYILANVEEGGTVYALGGSSIVSDTLRAVTNSGYTFKRLAGASRFETNLLILEEAGIESGDSVLVCTAYNFADSLSASALGMPILLVDDTVSAAQMAFLEENADGEFVLVGGTGAVKPAVEQQLREKWDVVRLAGASRFDTSVLTAIESFGYSVDYAVLAYGYNFPDGLCAGPLAYALGAPLILTANGDESAAVEYATAAGITDGFVLGGPSLIDDTVTRAIFSMGAGDSITR